MKAFEVKVKYEKMMEDGTNKIVSEFYLVDAMSFAEAESRTSEEMINLSIGKFEVAAIKKVNYAEIIKAESTNAGTWFKCKLAFITIDEKTEKEKKSNVTYLVEGSNLDSAKARMTKAMDGTMIDYVFVKIEETPIMDILYHKIANSEGSTAPYPQSNV